MGITQHVHGVDNVRSMLNLALARGFIGREKCGVMPIRGHSGVQGSAEMGAYATSFPNNVKITPDSAAELGRLWKFTPPSNPGLTAADMLHAAHREELDLLYCVGGNFLETLPDPKYVEEALKRVPMRVHQDIVLTSQMLTEPNEAVLLLPATTRYEQPGGGTETTTERRVIFSPEIRGRRIGEARSEWEILIKLAEMVYPERAGQIHFENAEEIRAEIALANPHYEGIQNLKKQGDQFQWGGVRLCDGCRFETSDGKAHFMKTVSPPDLKPPAEGKFRVSTRRGKQFNSMVHAKRDPLTGGLSGCGFYFTGGCARFGAFRRRSCAAPKQYW